MRLDAFAERVDDRFDQTIELLKSSFRTLDQKIDGMRDSFDQKIDRLYAKVDRLKR